MAAVALQTPQRHPPGAFIQTPAASQFQGGAIQYPLQRPQTGYNALQQGAGNSSQQALQQSQQAQSQQNGSSNIKQLDPVERAARSINEALTEETRYPELDSYIGQGISSDYEWATKTAWAPFQRSHMFPVPEKIYSQYNGAQISTLMGLFADIGHAWIAIDHALYLWDYAHPSRELVGFEEQLNPITAVSLVVPRAGCFVPTISRLLVIATTSEMIIIGLALNAPSGDEPRVALFQTRMSISVKGLNVSCIAGSAASGRLFFGGKNHDDVYEFTYQSEEKWFKGRCAKVNHSRGGYSTLTPSIPFLQTQASEAVVQVIIDDTRQLLYTLSSTSTIRTFHMKSETSLDLVITKTLGQTLSNVAHMISQSDLISPQMRITSIQPVSAQEASRLHLVATTSTGCRIFMSATSSYGYSFSQSKQAPTNMQVQHVKFPPPSTSNQGRANPSQPSSQISQYSGQQGINRSSKILCPTTKAFRYAPGFFFAVVARESRIPQDAIFVSGPDTGQIARPQDSSRLSKYAESGMWVDLGGKTEDVGLASAPFSAASTPTGFGNELSVQYDKPTTEVAVLTNTGIHTFRRRRLVDMLASAIRHGGGSEGLEGEMKTFVRLYGRGETLSTALAVACGQGMDVTADFRTTRVLDSEALEYARKAFIDFGGKPQFNENSLLDQSIPAIDMVKPSPRHEGLVLYVSRLVRSIWKAPIAQERVAPTGGFFVSLPIPMSKLRTVQEDLSSLKGFLERNKSFIEGLTGPEALGRANTRQEETSLQAEHRALWSIVVLVDSIIEGISFVLVLFDERMEDIVLSLSQESRQRLQALTYEALFTTAGGRGLAKELVKAIVNRNIANGSNVETVAEALRRRCGSFCSADDVKIFKGQELVKRASQAGNNSEFGRNILNESLQLFKQVTAVLNMEQLYWTVQQYKQMQFFAGAIQLILKIAQDKDRGNSALAWIQDGRPDGDPRATRFEARKQCYNLIHEVVLSLEQREVEAPTASATQSAVLLNRKGEAYNIINSSDDEVFQTNLYDWYLEQGRTDRILAIESPYVATYLERKSESSIAYADLLWKYYAQSDRHHDAATVQLALAKSQFTMTLNQRIEYLSRAKANASTHVFGAPRQQKQQLLREITDLLDVANIQDDLLQKLKEDSRIEEQKKMDVMGMLDGSILSVTEVSPSYPG